MNDEVIKPDTDVDGEERITRQELLARGRKWSKAALAAALGLCALTHPKEASAGFWANRRGGCGHWGNAHHGGGVWVNGGGGGAWANRRGGGGLWVNHR